MFTLTSLSSSFLSSAIFSSTGATAWHGPHQTAQKSTRTGVSLWRTSWSKFASVTSNAIASSIPFIGGSETLRGERSGRRNCSVETDPRLAFRGAHLLTPPGQAGSRRARARAPRYVGARGNVREAARAERGGAALQLRRR